MKLSLVHTFIVSILALGFIACRENEKTTATDEGTNPGECSDGADNDSDGDHDCNDSDCVGSPDCQDTATGTDTGVDTPSPNDVDDDGDGLTENEGDCDDTNPSIYPYAGDTYNDGVDSDCDGLDCEAKSDGSTYFAVCLNSQTRPDAQLKCTEAGYAGLVSIITSVEQDFLVNLSQAGEGSNWHYWTGFSDAASEGNWVWDSGLNSSSYENWCCDEPNNAGEGQHCSWFGGYGYQWQGSWFDDPCDISQVSDSSGDYQIGFACELR